MTNRIKQVVFPALAVAGLALLLASANESSAAGRTADGKSLFGQKCAACHALDGSGNTAAGRKLKVRALGSPETQKMADAKLIEIITKGKAKMPAFGSKYRANSVGTPASNSRSMVFHVRATVHRKSSLASGTASSNSGITTSTSLATN